MAGSQAGAQKRDLPKKQGCLGILTEKEHAVFDVLIEGYTARQTAARLCIAYRIACAYTRAVYRKLNVSSQAGLIFEYRNFAHT